MMNMRILRCAARPAAAAVGIAFLTAPEFAAGRIGMDGYADRVVVRDAGDGTAEWAVDLSGPGGFGDGEADVVVLYGVMTDLHMLGDVNGDGLTDKIVVRDGGDDTWLWMADFSTPTAFGDGEPDAVATYGAVSAHEPHAVADLNGDGYADRFLVQHTPDFHLYMVDFSADGVFGDGAPDDYASYGAPTMPLIGVYDMEGNGNADRVIDLDGTPAWAVDLSFAGKMGDGAPDVIATYGAPGMTLLMGELNNDGFGDRIVVIDADGTMTWQGDLSTPVGFGDGESDVFEQGPFGESGQEFLAADILVPGPFVVTSITRTAPGEVLLRWADQGSGTAYTVESSDAVSGAWAPAPPQEQWPITQRFWTDSDAGAVPVRHYRVLAGSAGGG